MNELDHPVDLALKKILATNLAQGTIDKCLQENTERSMDNLRTLMLAEARDKRQKHALACTCTIHTVYKSIMGGAKYRRHA